MTIRDDNRARVPGPVGSIVGAAAGRIPGPLGFQVVIMAPAPVAGATKILTVMPPPTDDQDNKDVHEVTWPLFNPSKKGPVHSDVKQAPSLANCPVAAILAAFASTAVGRTVIQGMVSPKTGNVMTDLSGLPPDTLTNPPMDNTTNPPKPTTVISSSRYFTVKLPGGAIDVSDVLYTNDGQHNSWSLLYMRDPSENSIWAAIIEKALAVQLKSYENFDALNLSANDFWEKVTGAKPGGIEIKDDTPLSKITDAAKASTRVPTIGASKPNGTDVKIVTEFHGFAMMGLEGAKIKLYDPAQAKMILISPTDFRHDFQAILFRR